tara:strand:+ start:781 stop:1224 length:444 start_codon:yes stop_codon:yes gene_type:complete
MAIRISPTSGSFVQDRDSNVFIGIDLPFRKSTGVEGYFASTSTTIEAVKTDIITLLNTRVGERVMQPNLGIDLHSYLFEQITPTLEDEIRMSIINTFKNWLPYVTVSNLEIQLEETTGLSNIMVIKLHFFIGQDPLKKEVVEVELTA